MVTSSLSWAHPAPISKPSPVRAGSVSQLFIIHLWKLLSFPKNLPNCRDQKFVSVFWRELMIRSYIQHSITQLKGLKAARQSEHSSHALMQYLRAFNKRNASTWLGFLPCGGRVCDAAVHSSTQCSLFLCFPWLTGKHLCLARR